MNMHLPTASAVILVMMTTAAAAQDSTGLPTTNTQDVVATVPTFTSIDQMTVGDLVGLVAYDGTGRKIGEIDYVIDAPEGARAILGIGGFIGLGEYTVAMPLTEFQLREDGRSFELATDKAALKAQPEIDEATIDALPRDTQVSALIE